MSNLSRRNILRLGALSTASLAALAIPGSRERTRQLQMPAEIPEGWQDFRGHLQKNTLGKAVTSYTSIGDSCCISAAHSGLPIGAEHTAGLEDRSNGKVTEFDLKVFVMRGLPHLKDLPIAEELPDFGTPVVHAGFGVARQKENYFAPGIMSSRIPRGVLLPVSTSGFIAPQFEIESLPFRSGEQTLISTGDSGGMVIAYHAENKRWELIGILVATTFRVEKGLTQKALQASPSAAAVDVTYPHVRSLIHQHRSRFGILR